MHLPTTLPSLLVGMTGLILAAPEPLTQKELKDNDRATASQSAPLLEEIAPTRELNTRSDQLSKLASIGMQNFAREIERASLLTIAAADSPIPAQDKPEPDPEGLLVTCEGGMYFDADKGHVVYLKDVVVEEPRFTMRAGKELKVFLEKIPDLPDKKPEEEPEKEGMKFPAFEGPANFSDIKNIIATGGVEVTKKDPQGKPIKATAATATYDAKTGDIILRGGFPLVQQGTKYVLAREAGLYIRIYANGNTYFQPGKWKSFASREDLEKNR